MTTTTTTQVETAPLRYPDGAIAHAPAQRRPYLDLFLISFLILFFELAAIRWFGSTVVFLTFFTNIVLLATFLGMSVGLLTASRRTSFMRWVLPLTAFAVALALIIANAYDRFDTLAVAVGGNENLNKSPQAIYFGTEYRHKDIVKFVIPMEVIAGTFFVLVSLIFIGLGQVMGRAFDAIPSRIGAYTVNIFGSLVGIAAFGVASFLHQSPHVWFFLGVLICLYFARPWNARQVVSAMVIMFIIAISAHGVGMPGITFWSPYYRISYVPQQGGIDTNGISHQQMLNIQEAGPAYVMPHLLNRDAGGKPYERMMIIGAGSGNDVAAALHAGANHIDAVEIDPVINAIGRMDHPDRPYDDERVKIHLNDGRNFVKKAPNDHYDNISYALVDSLVLHSGYSSLRLESFLFTKEAFADIHQKLKPGGVFAMYNYYRQGWVVARLKEMAKASFGGVEPIVISMPYQQQITPDDNQKDHITYLLVQKKDASGATPTLDAIRAKFSRSTNFWLHEKPRENESINGYRATAPDHSGQWRRIAPARVMIASTQPATLASAESWPSPMALLAATPATQPATPAAGSATTAPTAAPAAAAPTPQADSILLPTDNWPFLYLRTKQIPFKPSGTGMILIGAASLVLLLIFTWPVWFSRSADQPRGRFNLQMFFLGAGFMLLETKGVVHMALLFGSTWVVNSIVFFAILVMILLANLFVIGFKPRNLWPWYALLGVALLVAAFVPMEIFLRLPRTWAIVSSCAVFFVPVFFAGVIFAASFRDSRRPDVDFGSNIAGVILGGLSEQLSLMIGFNYLLLVALGFYFLSAIFKRRRREPEPAAVAEEPTGNGEPAPVPA